MKRIAMSNRGSAGLFVIVDDCDAAFCEARKIFLGNRKLYPSVTLWLDGKKHIIALHRALLGLWPGDGLIIDHKNGDRFDNRRANFRQATPAQSSGNTRWANRTGFKGVSTYDNRHYASIRGKVIGRFPTAEDAARGYDTAARAIWGEFAAVNFPRLDESPGRPPLQSKVA